MSVPWWTEADAAELDVFVFELSGMYVEHRERCEACRPKPCLAFEAWRAHLEECKACAGDAPLTYGPPCPRKREFMAHGADCPRCNPCSAVIKALRILGDWTEARELKSRAAWLRAERDRIEAA